MTILFFYEFQQEETMLSKTIHKTDYSMLIIQNKPIPNKNYLISLSKTIAQKVTLVLSTLLNNRLRPSAWLINLAMQKNYISDGQNLVTKYTNGDK